MGTEFWFALSSSVAAIFSVVAATFSAMSAAKANRIAEGANRIAERAALSAEKSFQTNIAPVIFFRREQEGTPWLIHNVGSGAALNVIVQGRNPEGELSKPLSYYTVPSGDEVKHVMEFGDELCAWYHDLVGNQYITTCKGNKNAFDMNLSPESLSEYRKTWNFENPTPAIKPRQAEVMRKSDSKDE